MRGLNTEVHPTKLSGLKEPAFPQFQNLTMRRAVLAPVAGDGTHATTTFRETSLGTYAVSEPFSINGVPGFLAYVALLGGTVTLRSPAAATGPLAVAAPGTGPSFAGYTFTRWDAGMGGYGTVDTYAAAWTDGGVVSGLSDTVEVTTAPTHFLAMGSVTGSAPIRGDTVTAGTGTANQATAQAYHAGGVHTEGPWALVSDLAGTFASGDTVTWASGTGTLEWAAMDSTLLQKFSLPRGLNIGTVGDTTSGTTGTGTLIRKHFETTMNNYFVYGMASAFAAGETVTIGTSSGIVSSSSLFGAKSELDGPGAVPSGATGWALFRLADSGIYYEVGTATGTASVTDGTPYASLSDLSSWPGPLDANGYPEPLTVPGTCQTLALHKGCLFVAAGNLLKWSEAAISGIEYRWFREGFGIDCGGTIWALVSRNEWLEVFTDKGIKYIVGSSPYFEIRESQIHEIAVSRYSITGTDQGTFYHAADGLRRLNGQDTKLLSQGWNGPWFDDIAAPGSTVGGASKGVYYLVDATGRCLCWDWEKQEWRSRTFSGQPAGFSWSETELYLVAKVGANYLAVESDAEEPVSWIVQYPSRAGSKNRPIDSFFWLNNVGPLSIKVYVDDDQVGTIPVPHSTRGRVRLPMVRGHGWHMTMEGTGTPETSAILGIEDE